MLIGPAGGTPKTPREDTMDNHLITGINLKVALMDTDYYAMQAINGYLAWDRRTRVILLSELWRHLWEHVDLLPEAELPDIVILDAEAFPTTSAVCAMPSTACATASPTSKWSAWRAMLT